MAISKIILNGTVQMDVTDKTVTADAMLYGITSLLNDGTDITGTIVDGNNIGYGLTDGTLPLVGVGQVGYAVI